MLIPLHQNTESIVDLCIDFPDRISSDWNTSENICTIDFGLFFVDKENKLSDPKMAIFYNNTQTSPQDPIAKMIDNGAKVFFQFDPAKLLNSGVRYGYLIAFIDVNSSKDLLSNMSQFSILVNNDIAFSARGNNIPRETTMLMSIIDLKLLAMKAELVGIKGDLQAAYHYINELSPPDLSLESTAWENLSIENQSIETFEQIDPQYDLFFVKLTMTSAKNKSLPTPSLLIETESEGKKSLLFGSTHQGLISYSSKKSSLFELSIPKGIQSGVKSISLILNTNSQNAILSIKDFSLELYASNLNSLIEQRESEIDKWFISEKPKEWGGITLNTKTVSLLSLDLKNRTIYCKIRSSEEAEHIFPSPPNNPIVVQQNIRLKKSKQTPKASGINFDKNFRNNVLHIHGKINRASKIQVNIEDKKMREASFTINESTEEQTELTLENILSYDKLIRIDFSLKR